jgi:hypothetical protein
MQEIYEVWRPQLAGWSYTFTVCSARHPGSSGHRHNGVLLQSARKENEMTVGTILLIILILLLIGALPSWPYSRSWGYAPTGGLGVVLIIIIVLLALGYI